MPLLKQIRLNNDLGHPLCCNIRDGRWLCDYITYRLKVFNGTKKLGSIVEKFFEPLHGLQHYLKPCYFEAILHYIYVSILHHLDKKLNPWVFFMRITVFFFFLLYLPFYFLPFLFVLEKSFIYTNTFISLFYLKLLTLVRL